MYYIAVDVGDVEHPAAWSESQWNYFQKANRWLRAAKGNLGCSTCKAAKQLPTALISKGVSLAIPWVRYEVTTNPRKPVKCQVTSLRKKIHEHRNSKAHKIAQDLVERKSSLSRTETMLAQGLVLRLED